MSTPAAAGSALDRYFRFAENGTTLARDTMAGATTFVVMSYIIFVNPQILSFAGVEGLQELGLPFNQVLAVTCLVAGVMTIAMGLYANRAYAIAPGLGINAVVAFSLVAGEGLSFPAAMGLIVVEGIAVTILVLTGLRERVMDAIPLDLKKAIAIGIGLFIAFIGLENAGIVVKGEPLVDLAPLTTWPILVAVFGLLLTIALRARGVRGDLLIGIVAATVLATIVNEASGNDAGFTAGASWPGDVYESPDLGLLGEFNFDAFTELAFLSAVVWAFSLFMADFFDTMGTLVGVGKQAGYLKEGGELPELHKPLLVDSLAAVAGGAASSSSATTYIESASGISTGGRTGWVAVVCGALFLPRSRSPTASASASSPTSSSARPRDGPVTCTRSCGSRRSPSRSTSRSRCCRTTSTGSDLVRAQKKDVRTGDTAPRTPLLAWSLRSMGLARKERVPRPGAELRKVREPARAELPAKAVRCGIDRRRRARRREDEHVPSRRNDATQLLEERDHVDERDELERGVRKRQRRRVGDLEPDAAGQLRW